MVSFLNTLFTHFDSHVDRHGVYKVDIIGDAYFIGAAEALPFCLSLPRPALLRPGRRGSVVASCAPERDPAFAPLTARSERAHRGGGRAAGARAEHAADGGEHAGGGPEAAAADARAGGAAAAARAHPHRHAQR